MDKKDWSYLFCSYLSGVGSLLISAAITAVVILVEARVLWPKPLGWVLLFAWCVVGFSLALNCRARMFFYTSVGIGFTTTLVLVLVLATKGA